MMDNDPRYSGPDDFGGDEYALEERDMDDRERVQQHPVPGLRRSINPDTNCEESEFREAVRNALGLHWDARDATIIDEINRLRERAERTETVGQYALRMTKGVR